MRALDALQTMPRAWAGRPVEVASFDDFYVRFEDGGPAEGRVDRAEVWAAGLRRAVRSTRAWPDLGRVGHLLRRTFETIVDQRPEVLAAVRRLRSGDGREEEDESCQSLEAVE